MNDKMNAPRQPAEDVASTSVELATDNSSISSLQPCDAEIVARMLSGDLSSFELLMRRYNQRLFRLARSIVLDDSEAEDVVQESYVRAYLGLGQLENHAMFSLWITKIAYHESLARRLRSIRMISTDFTAPENASLFAAVSKVRAGDALDTQELGQILTAAVDALPEELRAVFTLRVIEGLDTQETAGSLELTEANVKTRLHRARLFLQGRIDQQIGTQVRHLYQFGGERCNRIVADVLARLRISN